MTKVKKKEISYISYAMVPVVYILIQVLNRAGIINAYIYQILMLAGINGIMAMSLNLVNGMTGQFSLGHAGFMSVGAYIAAMMTNYIFKPMMTNPVSSISLYVIALLIGGLVAAFIGLLIGIPSLRLRGDYLAIITLGFSEVIRTLWRVIPASGQAKGLTGIAKLSSFTFIFVAVIVIMILLRNFTNSSYGRNCIAIRENELAAETMGIDTTAAKIKSFVFSAFVAGIGGGLYAHLMMFIQPDMFNSIKSTDMLLYLYAGGVGSYTSAFLGATVFTILPEMLRFMNEWRMVLYAIILILIMLKRPQGIFGRYEFGFMRFGKKDEVIGDTGSEGVIALFIKKLKPKNQNTSV